MTTGLIIETALLIFEKSVPVDAEKTSDGIKGKVGRWVLLMPLFGVLGFVGFAVLSQDVEIAEGFVTYALYAMAAIISLLGVKMATFTVRSNADSISSGSLITPRRQIRWHEPFAIVLGPDQKAFSLIQQDSHIRISRMVSGYQDFLALAVKQYEKNPVS